MDAEEIVSALQRGDPAGVAVAYDRYGGRLYGYCSGLLADAGPDAPSAAVRAALVAAVTAERPASPHRLGPWLYALCRLEVNDLRAADPTSVLGPAVGAFSPGAPTVALERPIPSDTEPAVAVVSRLENGHREAIELAYRHGLTNAEVAAVVGVPDPVAAATLASAQGAFEHLYLRLVGLGWREGLTRYGRSPLPEPPAGLRAQVLAAVGAETMRSAGAGPGDPVVQTWDTVNLTAAGALPDGGTMPRQRGARRRTARRQGTRREEVWIVAAVALVVVLAATAGLFAFLQPSDQESSTAVVLPGPQGASLAGPGRPVPATVAPTSATPSVSASPSPAAAGRRPTAVPRTPAARVSVTVQQIDSDCKGDWEPQFTATVTGHPVRYVNVSYWWPGQAPFTYGTAAIGNGRYIVKPDDLPFDTTISYRADVVRTDGRQVSSATRTVRKAGCDG